MGIAPVEVEEFGPGHRDRPDLFHRSDKGSVAAAARWAALHRRAAGPQSWDRS
ncbi:hypothetical protein RGE_05720 [Rubrivivax gelatinosus IL144]|uniref:Uncharacterized protein n=1 Tax=Rubrivivax gelatinosus (strain NBRC 100245 / IL144) TaxID=983917 RepID=I0HLN0_RUBGI|nr:hypothetical protein RGE_05720 [Rubrivivax gelatinosus IL144]